LTGKDQFIEKYIPRLLCTGVSNVSPVTEKYHYF